MWPPILRPPPAKNLPAEATCRNDLLATELLDSIGPIPIYMAFICLGTDEIAKLSPPAADVTIEARASLGGVL